MPTIAIVEGILILLYFNDHAPPHFHAQGPDFRARVRIEDGTILDSEGNLSSRHRRRLLERTLPQRADLLENWVIVRTGNVPRRLD